jgi:hypothetical protein
VLDLPPSASDKKGVIVNKEPAKNADEFDATTRWRHVMFWRPGERKKIKQRMNRRFRRRKDRRHW